jgi:hypothetical protein
MHKIRLLTVFCLALCLTAPFGLTAQQVSWSNARKLKGLAVFTKVIGQNEKGLFLLRYKSRFLSRNVILEKYRIELGYAYSKNLVLRRSQMEFAGMLDGQILLIKSEWKKRDKKKVLKGALFENDLQQKSPYLELIESNDPGGYDRTPFLFAQNALKNRLVMASKQILTEGEETRIDFQFYDHNFQKTASKSVRIPHDPKLIFPMELATDDELGTHFLFRLKKKGIRRVDLKSNLYLIHIDNESDSIRQYLLGDSLHFYTQPVVSYDRFQKRFIIQQVHGLNQTEGQSGIYTFSLSNEAEIHEHYLSFDSSFIEEMNPKRTLDGDPYLSDYGVIKSIPLSNGGILSVIERSSISAEEDVMVISGVPQNSSRNIYNFEDVAIIAQNDTGGVIWHKVINKSQSTINDGGYYSSVIPVVTNTAVHLIFNDMLLNIGTALQYTLRSDGEINSKILLGNEREYVSVIPTEAAQINSREWILPVMKDRKFAIVKLSYAK